MKQAAMMVLTCLIWFGIGKVMGAPGWAAYMFGVIVMFIYFPPPPFFGTNPTQEADK